MAPGEYTFRLFKKRPSFLDGMASLIDMSPSINKYNTDKTEKDADIKSIQADWLTVGKDMKDAIEKYAAAESTQSSQ